VKIAVENIHKNSGIINFPGGGVRVVNTATLPVNNFVVAERREIILQDSEPSDEQGILYLYPIEDNSYCLELHYLQYGDGPADADVVYVIRYLPAFFKQFADKDLIANRPFRFDQTTEQQFTVCSRSRSLLQQMDGSKTGTPITRSLEATEVVVHLLRRALECITVPFAACQVPACRFLAFEGERDKITAAMRIIEANIDQPHTIRELSRKVAMNECYLKKGFKAITGKTIHEYQQSLRIAQARILLQEQGRTVTDVANTLGYSSISHFSTAFKKVTGMKPCELLA
jgi:AraC-like DNA-binding protein